MSLVTEAARAAVLANFRWESGHADVWRVFANADAFATIIDALAAPWREHGITHVAGIEARGFLLGAPVAVALHAGFVAIRKADGLFPGPKHVTTAAPDYRGIRHQLRMQAILAPGDRVLLVDDWAELGSQARAARQLVETGGATFVGVSLVVDQVSDATRAELGAVTGLVQADELGPSD